MTFLLLLSAARAGDVFDSVEAEVTLGMGGTWARVHSTDAGYWFFQVAGGDGWMEDIGADLTGYSDRDRVQLSHIAKIQDAQIERCADGGWLLIGSYTLDAFDDSAQAWRFDSELNPLWNVTVAERDSTHKHNDMVPVCTAAAEGGIFAGAVGGNGAAEFVPLAGGELGEAIDIPGIAAEGASTAEYGEEGASLVVDGGGPGAHGVTVHEFDLDWNEVDSVDVTLSTDSVVWPQRIQKLGDGWLLAYLTTTSNTPFGDVWLAALDADFQVVDQIEVNSAGGQDNRPWFARQGDDVLVAYDRDVQPRVRLVHLADGASGGDDGIPDTAAPDDSGGGGGDGEDTAAGGAGNEKECACASTSAVPPLGAIFLAATALARRRRVR